MSGDKVRHAPYERLVRFPLIKIAYKNDELFSVWGPCSGEGKIPCDCQHCKHADALESEGLDWEIEYQKAKKKDIDHLQGS